MWIPFLEIDDLPRDFLVTAMVPFGTDTTLVTTLSSGLFLLHHDELRRFELTASNPLLQEKLLSCIPVNKELVAIGTNQGCYFINKQGDLIQKLGKAEGLQNNTVLSLFLDKNSNLWLGLENGIDFAAYNNAIKHIYPYSLNEGVGYSSILYNGELFLGTSIGLFRIPTGGERQLSDIKNTFRSIPNIEGSAWSLTEVDGKLLMGHHEGAFEICGGKALPISKRTGYWNFLPIRDIFESSYVIAGNYNGLDFFQKAGNVYIPKGNLINFNEASRFVAIDKNKTIWIAHPYRGVFKIDMNRIDRPETRFYGDQNGLPSSAKNHLFKIKGRVAVTTEKGVFEYDKSSDRFIESTYFRKYFDKKNIRYLKEDLNGNIWFIDDKTLGVVDFSKEQEQIIYFPELNGKMVINFPHINPFDQRNVIVGAEKGFYHINFEKYKEIKNPITVAIRSVKATGVGDSLFQGGFLHTYLPKGKKGTDKIAAISDHFNTIHFEFSSPAYERQASIEYSYLLKGFDKDWSVWNKKTEKEYTNLAPGNYVFNVKAKSNLGDETTVSSYAFKIMPPWYRSAIAYTVYAALLLLLVYLLARWQMIALKQQHAKHLEEQRKLQYVHQLEMEKSEKEIIALRNQQLTTEIGSKNSELASVAMHLLHKGELLSKLKDELIRLKKDPGFDQSQNEFRKIIKIFNEENQMDKDWEVFAGHFDTVNGDFLKLLRETFPNLTSTEIKLAAYLRMNLSSKEIAKLMNISVRGVEISRYRLRKKLNIPTEITFYNFLSEFSSSKTT